MPAFRHIGLFCLKGHAQSQETLESLQQQLEARHYQVSLYPLTSPETDPEKTPVDVVISIGGDGTLLRIARGLSLQGIPVIGINRGTLGFLTDILPHQILSHLIPMLEGHAQESQRFLLEGSSPQHSKKNNALNDIVLFSGQASLLEFELRIDGEFVYRQRSDGLIISTPTGSTAYALSAGGPVLTPDVDAILLVPKSPHALSFRPLVIPSHQNIQLEVINYRDQAPKISFDGHEEWVLEREELFTISRQAKPLRLLHPKTHNDYQVLRSKLHWSVMPT